MNGLLTSLLDSQSSSSSCYCHQNGLWNRCLAVDTAGAPRDGLACLVVLRFSSVPLVHMHSFVIFSEETINCTPASYSKR